MGYIFRFFGDPPRKPWTRTPIDYPVGVWFQILKVCADPVFVFSAEIWVELIPKMPYIIRFFGDLSPRGPLDPWTPMGHPVGVWFEILKVCADPVFVFSAEIWVELITKMPYIIRFFGDLPRGPLHPGTPMGVWFKISKVCWPCIRFQCWNLSRIDTQNALYH